MYLEMIGQMKKTLAQLDHWLEAAAAHATAKSFDSQRAPGVALGAGSVRVRSPSADHV